MYLMSDDLQAARLAGAPSVPIASDQGAENERALRDLSHVLAHRLRSLVSSIEGYTDLLADTLGTREQREITQRVFEGAARIEHVLADLQRYSQSIDPVCRTLAVDTVVDELHAVFDAPTRARVEVVRRDDAPTLVEADPVLLRQALLVLLQNALEAVDEGDVVQLLVEHDAVRQAACFSVWNPGAVPLDDPEDVFRPFCTTKASNLGVGLPIARRIAVAHDGTLELDYTDPRRGTCFTLAIPTG